MFLGYCLIWTAVYIHVTTTSQDKEHFQHLKVFLCTFVVDSLSRSSTTPYLLYVTFALKKIFLHVNETIIIQLFVFHFFQLACFWVHPCYCVYKHSIFIYCLKIFQLWIYQFIHLLVDGPVNFFPTRYFYHYFYHFFSPRIFLFALKMNRSSCPLLLTLWLL